MNKPSRSWQMALVPLLLSTPLHVVAQCSPAGGPTETARGIVFVDSNASGRLDAGETGLEGVAVSNGCEVVVTNSAGRYEISISPTDILMISKPAGYAVPLDENNIPQFFYRHRCV